MSISLLLQTGVYGMKTAKYGLKKEPEFHVENYLSQGSKKVTILQYLGKNVRF